MHGHFSCNVWAKIKFLAIVRLTPIMGRFTSDENLKFLDEVLLSPYRKYLFPDLEIFIFVITGSFVR